jgi:hypothetical protein
MHWKGDIIEVYVLRRIVSALRTMWHWPRSRLELGCVVKPRVCPPGVTRSAQRESFWVLVHCEILFSISSGSKIGV